MQKIMGDNVTKQDGQKAILERTREQWLNKVLTAEQIVRFRSRMDEETEMLSKELLQDYISNQMDRELTEAVGNMAI